VKSNVLLAMTRNTQELVWSQTKPGSLPRIASDAVGTLKAGTMVEVKLPLASV